MSHRDLSARFRYLALWLSLLALLSALLAPAAVLAQDMRTGKWTGLCSAGMASAQDQHLADDDAGHCGLCVLAGLALPMPAGPDFAGELEAVIAQSWVAFDLHATPLGQPAIRGPPALV